MTVLVDAKEAGRIFEITNGNAPQELVAQWSAMSTAPWKDSKGQWQSVFRHEFGKGDLSSSLRCDSPNITITMSSSADTWSGHDRPHGT